MKTPRRSIPNRNVLCASDKTAKITDRRLSKCHRNRRRYESSPTIIHKFITEILYRRKIEIKKTIDENTDRMKTTDVEKKKLNMR